MATFSRVINKIDDRINPIVVKEIRQYLNGRSIVPLVILTLLLELGAMLVFMMSQVNSVQGRGLEFFTTVMTLLALACIVGVAFPAAGRISQERKIDALDLVYTTVLSPYRIVSGKLFSGMAMVSLLISLCLPFMCVSYYLRGIDLPTILTSTYLLLLLMLPLIQGMVLFGVLCSSIVYRIILMIIGANLFFSLIGGAGSLFRMGVPRWSGGPDTGWALLVLTLMSLLVTTGFYVLSVAMISHATANRATPIRIYLAATWLAIMLILLMVQFCRNQKIELNEWAVAMMLLFGASALFSIGEREDQSRRVLRQVPHGFLRRVVYFLFSSGFANGLLFSLLFLLLTLLLYRSAPGSSSLQFFDNPPPAVVCTGIAMYMVAYAALSMCAKQLLQRFIPRINMIVIIIGLVSCVLFIPMIICAMIYKERCVENDLSAPFMILTPAIFGYNEYRGTGVIISFVLAAVCLLLALPILWAQVKAHFPPEPGSEPVAAPHLEEEDSKHADA